MRTKRKFAWLPTIVWTWRPTPSEAVIWLQEYFIEGVDQFAPLNGKPSLGEKYCNRLGLFSIEF